MLAPLLALSLLALPAAAAGDWPTVHADNQRSGHTARTLAGPFARKWFRDFHDEMIATRVEAIVAEHKAYVGTFSGNVHALDAATGQTAWTFRTAGPVGASACYRAGRIFVASDDNFVYALTAADGKELWRYRATAGVWAAPACDDRLVYVGDRAGVFHAIDQATGRPAWTFATGGMILAPASISADGRKIVVPSEDLHVYCLDPAGKLLWTSPKLGGLSLRDHAPTLWQGLAIVRTNPAIGFHHAAGENPAVLTRAQKALETLPEDKVLHDKWGGYVMKYTPRRMDAERAAILKFLADNPAEKTFYAFDLADGHEPWTAPVLYTAGLHNPPTPPTFDPTTGALYLWTPTALSTYSAGVPAGAIAVGQLDRKTGLVDLIPHGNGDTFNSSKGFCPPADETFALSLMGRTLLNTHQGIVGGMNLDTRAAGVLFGRRDTYGGVFGPGLLPANGDKGGDVRAHLAGQLVFMPNEWHGPDRAIVSIADDRFFWVVGSQIVCVGGPEIPATATGGKDAPAEPLRRRLPAITPGGNVANSSFGKLDPSVPTIEITAAQLAKYLDLPAPSKQQVDGALRAQLDAAVLELIDGGPWAPLIVELGISGEERHFWRTSETMRVLAEAIPHCSPQVATKARKHLARMFAAGVPLKTPAHDPSANRREPYDFGPEMLRFAGEPVRYAASAEDLYALWAFAHYADGWDALLSQREPIHAMMRDVLDRPVKFDHADKENDSAEHLNRQIGGTLAYARIMTRAGDADEARRAATRLAELVTLRVHHERADSDLVRPTRVARYKLHQAAVPRYAGLTPELCQMLREFAGEAYGENVRALMTALPIWHHAWGERMVGGENYVSPPTLSVSLFTAGVGAGIDVSAKLDRPWCRADLFYVEKLTWLLNAGGLPAAQPHPR